MSFWNTPYNQLAFKASHNSYLSAYDLHRLLSWDNSRPSDFGCRGLEIDFSRHSDSSGGRSIGFFQVGHPEGASGPPLALYLGELLSYHFNNRGHDPILVTLCIKSQDGPVDVFPQELDAYLEEWFYRPAIFSPGNLIVQGLDLVSAVRSKGWPLAEDLRDRFILCLSGTKEWKAQYANSSPPFRLCFADLDFSDDTPNPVIPETGNRIIANMNLFTDHFHYWKYAVPQLRRQSFLVRGYVVDSAELWAKARSAEVNAIATDDVQGSHWASVGSSLFV